MIIRKRMLYRPPVKSVSVPIIGHSGEVVIPVNTTIKLAKWLNEGQDRLIPDIKREVKRLINTVPMRI
jgi:malate/lactate dehydrogenase